MVDIPVVLGNQIPMVRPPFPTGSRVTSFSVDVLSKDEVLLGRLTNVVGGELSWTANSSIKSTGTLDVVLTGDQPNWLTARLRPVMKVWPPDAPDLAVEYPLGVYLAAAPARTLSREVGASRIELVDKLAVLDQDVIGAPVYDINSPVSIGQTYTIHQGFNVVQAIKNILEQSGEAHQAILLPNPPKGLPSTMVWEAGTSRLQVINDMLDAINYFSLWCDSAGQFRVSPWVSPDLRPEPYSEMKPMVVSETSMLTSDITWDQDIYSIPNRVLLIGQGSGDTPALKGQARNLREDSPFSFPSRGRWITHVKTGVEASSAHELEQRAISTLWALTAVASTYTVSHPPLPLLRINDTIPFEVPSLGIMGRRGTVISTTIPLTPTGLSKTVLRDAEGLD